MQIALVDGRDFQFSPCRRLYVLGRFDDAVGIEVKSYDGVVALGAFRLFLYAEAFPVCIEFCNAIPFRVVDVIAEDGCLVFLLCTFYTALQQAAEARPVEDVVAQDQTHGILSDELLAYYESLCQSVG